MPIRVEVFETQVEGRRIPAGAEADSVMVPMGGSARVTLDNGQQFLFSHRPTGGAVQVLRPKAGLRDIITNDEIQRFTVLAGTVNSLTLATLNNAVPKVAFRTVGTQVVLVLNPNQT